MRSLRQLQRPAVRVRRSRRTAAHDDGLLWLFDLDNTLHDTSHAIFPRIDHGMTMAVAETLGVDIDTANHLRRKYWKRYGATMIGLVRHHGVDPHEFLHRSHDFDVNPLVRREGAGLQAAPAARTQGAADQRAARVRARGAAPTRHPAPVRQPLGHRAHAPARRVPPQAVAGPAALRAGARGASPRRTVLVEDTLANLRGARAGLRTVHVYHPGTPFGRGRSQRPSYVDLRVNSVSDLLLRRRPLRG